MLGVYSHPNAKCKCRSQADADHGPHVQPRAKPGLVRRHEASSPQHPLLSTMSPIRLWNHEPAALGRSSPTPTPPSHHRRHALRLRVLLGPLRRRSQRRGLVVFPHLERQQHTWRYGSEANAWRAGSRHGRMRHVWPAARGWWRLVVGGATLTSATPLSRGSSGFGALSSACMLSSTVRICSAGDHLSCTGRFVVMVIVAVPSPWSRCGVVWCGWMGWV